VKTTHLRFLALFVLFASSSLAALQPGDSARLDETLRLMEGVGKTFRSFKANVTQKKYTAVLKEFDTAETGEFLYARAGDGSAMLRLEILKPGKRTLTIKGGVATIFTPGVNQAQIINLGKNKDKAEYLALGLGQTPGKLKESFDVRYQGAESVGNAPCSMLVLKPRNPSAAAFFSSITLWIRKSSGVPVQQKLQEPNGDFLLVSFTDEVLNPKIPLSRFDQKFPSGAEIQRIQ
jgi:outer membrane lipoprotein-sorting protein